MYVTSAIVLYLVVWMLCLMVAAPIRVRTQGDLGKVEAGTSPGSPVVHHLKLKLAVATGAAFAIWLVIAAIILSGWISVEGLGWGVGPG